MLPTPYAAPAPTPPNGRANARATSEAPSLPVMSVPQRLSGLQHVLDALLGLLGAAQRHEVLALQVEQPLLVDHAARLDRAAGEDLRDARRDVVVVLRDEAALLHVHEEHLER